MTADETFMRRALDLAMANAGKTGGNPAVGCVLVKDGVVVGEGATGAGGRPHAEEAALLRAGEEARGATAYVTLEPCALRSNGGVSCSELLGGARVVRVVIANFDPHPNAAGVGIARLRGVGVEVTLGVLEEEAAAHNAAWFASIG
jgi:diaminohydroxyphosphoribosylaminopyrimidine deaminase/5-amino-6-(5-phosphoribosylamino)uracil reductase